MKLTADLVESFGGMYLSPRFDDASPTPQWHREAWELYCSDYPQVVCVAPREHAKSTALTFVYILANALFKTADYIILISSTEPKAQELLSNIIEELKDNEDLRRDFLVAEFETEQKTEVIVKLGDGHRFRILARGSEQKIRGALWNGKRPNLLVCDDMEDDEQVESKDRRTKFRHWFFRAAKQAVSLTSGRVRVHGTILHEDSLLARLRKNKTWKALFYRAHNSFDDFGGMLWPERWTEKALRFRRQEFIEDHDSAGYSQEFLNDPFDHDEAYLRREDFLPMEEEDHKTFKIICAAADFAISTKDSANRTSFTVGGKCPRNLLHFVDQRVGRWDSLRIVEEIFSIHAAWNPDIFWVEDGQIWKAISPMVYAEMQRRDTWINIMPRQPITDKASRGRSLQRRMRARGCRFDKSASWYPGFEAELLRFTGVTEAVLDDQFDSAALLSLGFDSFKEVDAEDEITEDEWADRRRGQQLQDGRSSVTGY